MQARDYETENACGRQRRQAVQTRPCGGIPADLTFLLLFWSSKKVEEENMNGRLYDPVIARFFSPDQYVQDATATQSYNRYSYAANCPLIYTDPTGQQMNRWAYYMGDGTHEFINNEGGEFVQTIDFYSGSGGGGGGGGEYLGSVTFLGSSLSINWEGMPGMCPNKGGGSGGGGGATSGYIPPPTLRRTEATNTLATYRGVMLNTVTCSTSRAGGMKLDWSSMRNGVDNFTKAFSELAPGKTHFPTIPINDVTLKNLGYGTTTLSVLAKSLKYGKYVPWITGPINAVPTYNALVTLWNHPSLEHFYRFANAAAGFSFVGGFMSSTLNIYEDAAIWGINQIQSVEMQLQSTNFWSNIYGY